MYVAFPRSQYYALSATLRPLQPQVVQSPRDGSQRFPRSHDCPLHSGLGCSWTPVRCSLHPHRGLYACTPLAGTVWPGGPLARSVPKPSYATTHAILIISQRVHALDALNGASSRSHTGVQAGGLRVWMRYCPLPLVPSGFGRVLPPCRSPAELASGSSGDAPVSTGVVHHPFFAIRALQSYASWRAEPDLKVSLHPAPASQTPRGRTRSQRQGPVNFTIRTWGRHTVTPLTGAPVRITPNRHLPSRFKVVYQAFS